MADRLTEIIIGLQRLAENARVRTDDVFRVRTQEDAELAHWLDQQILFVDKVRDVLVEQRQRFPAGQTALGQADQRKLKPV